MRLRFSGAALIPLVALGTCAAAAQSGQPASPPRAPRGSVVRVAPPPRAPVSLPPHRPSRAPEIVFEAPSIPGGGSVQEICTMNLDGSGLTQISHDGLSKFLPHFSPDGTRLLYTKFLVGQYGDPNVQTAVVIYDFATALETQLTFSGTGFQPVWSPDGGRVAYGSYLGDSLWIMNADGSDLRLIGGPSGALDDAQG